MLSECWCLPESLHRACGMLGGGVERAGCAVSDGRGASDPGTGVPQPLPSPGAFHVCAQLRLGLP